MRPVPRLLLPVCICSGFLCDRRSRAPRLLQSRPRGAGRNRMSWSCPTSGSQPAEAACPCLARSVTSKAPMLKQSKRGSGIAPGAGFNNEAPGNSFQQQASGGRQPLLGRGSGAKGASDRARLGSCAVCGSNTLQRSSPTSLQRHEMSLSWASWARQSHL